ncbi:MAG: hypothetical protein PHV02_03270 [Rhodocyclaceae bacterium]|nr:hypothetical protein [Rhodocyclaceae bacterium]
MTIRYTADVFCNGCGNWMHGKTSDKPTGLARPSREAARKAGWSHSNTSIASDLCPECMRKASAKKDQKTA